MQIPSCEQLNKEFDSGLWPEFTALSGDKSIFELGLKVRETLNYFPGHFPNQAVLPGVVQVHWVGALARRIFDCADFEQVKSVKFNTAILPGASLSLSLSYQADSGRLKFSFFDAQQRYSSGVMIFGAQQ